jgi:TonB family protein
MHVAFLLAASLGRPGSEGARSAARVARWVVAAVFALLLATATPAQTHRPLPDLAPEQIATPGANVVPPRPIVAPNAAYTDSARRAQYEGTARVEFVVDSNGNVRNLSVIQDLPYGLGVAAREAVRTWKFQPATLNGKPVAYRGATEMEFRLVQSPARPAQPSLA